jgi:hypothetical protein
LDLLFGLSFFVGLRLLDEQLLGDRRRLNSPLEVWRRRLGRACAAVASGCLRSEGELLAEELGRGLRVPFFDGMSQATW